MYNVCVACVHNETTRALNATRPKGSGSRAVPESSVAMSGASRCCRCEAFYVLHACATRQRARARSRTSTAQLSHNPAHFARAKPLHPPLILQLARFLALSCLLLSPNNASRTACARADRLYDHSYDWPARDSAPRCSRRRWGSARASVADPHGHGTCWRCCRRRGRGRCV